MSWSIFGPKISYKQATRLNTLPLFFPIPSFDRHVVTSGQDNVRGRMNGETPYIVRMCLECYDLFMCIVIEDAQLKVVGACNEPALPSDESTAPDWDLGDFECLHQCSRLVIVYVDRAIIETS
jgi:hypothetical protein